MKTLLHWIALGIRVALLALGFAGLAVVLTGSGNPNQPGDWFRFYLPWDDASPSLIDAGLEKPAGQRGFVKVSPQGHFQFKDGTPIRFWGANLGAQTALLPATSAAATAGRWRKPSARCCAMKTCVTVMVKPRAAVWKSISRASA